jgi:F-type H+-transporting ATPase subunit gamma
LIQDSLAKILDASPDAGNSFFDKRLGIETRDKTVGYLVITADKGLAGAYNHNVIKLAEQLAENEEKDLLFIVGQLGRHYFEKKDIPFEKTFNYTAQNPNMNRARHIAGRLTDMFLAGKIDEVYVVYTKMINSMSVEAVSQKLLPLNADDIEKQDTELVEHYKNATFLPDAQTVFNKIVPDYITGFIYGALIESYCSEHNARMMAMQTATDSATTMIKDLSIQYNRARQAAITQEITEVVGGSRASKNG